VREEVTAIPASTGQNPVIIATGPLTSDALSAAVARLVGADHLYFYDAISPIVLADTIDRTKVFRASRWNRSVRGVQGDPRQTTTADGRVGGDDPVACGIDDGEGDYLNCPMTRDEYEQFYEALITAESATVHDFEKETFFEGCLPIEVMASRGRETLRFGPMKPVGLIDPRSGREPYAVVQLRQDTLAGDHYSLVGFQTQLKWGEQGRVLRLIPGLERVEFVRYGIVHRNTYVNGPAILSETWQVRSRPTLLFAGQMSGVEGYVESAASGLLAGLTAAALAKGEAPSPAPRATAIGSLAYYVSHANPAHYDPSNITFGIMPPLPRAPKNKLARKLAISSRALAELDRWIAERQGARGTASLVADAHGAAAER
jgi:methylenetetrahydrofolate--tRNA-(uracil-5-)-methyltransferase